MGEKEGKGDEKDKKPAENQKKKEGDGGDKKGGGGAGKEEEGPPKVVFKVDLHCEGCASKIKRAVKGFEGVEGVTTDMASNKLTVIGRVDASKLQDRVEAKTRKKLEILSSVSPQKNDAGGSKKSAVTAGDLKKNSDDKNPPKEAAISTVVLKIRLHCDGCIRRIKKTILKMKGVQGVTVDAQKDLVTVKGSIDVSSLPSYLKEKLNRGVEVISAKNDAGGEKEKPAAADGGGNGAGEKKEKGGNGGGGEKKDKGGSGGGGGDVEKKKEDGGGGGKKEAATAVAAAPVVLEANKMNSYGGEYGYSVEMLHAPQIFSDENPNACSIM